MTEEEANTLQDEKSNADAKLEGESLKLASSCTA